MRMFVTAGQVAAPLEFVVAHMAASRANVGTWRTRCRASMAPVPRYLNAAGVRQMKSGCREPNLLRDDRSYRKAALNTACVVTTTGFLHRETYIVSYWESAVPASNGSYATSTATLPTTQPRMPPATRSRRPALSRDP